MHKRHFGQRTSFKLPISYRSQHNSFKAILHCQSSHSFSKKKQASIMPNLASSLKTIIAEQLDVSVESVCLFPGSLPSLVKQLMQMKVTDTARLKEHLKLDKAGIPSLTAALLEVCISRHPFLVRDCLIDGG
jgi:hypothetical protein